MAATLLIACLAAWAQPASPPPNLLPNPSFELVEPPAPVAGAPSPAPRDVWLPRTWNAWPEGDARMRCPDAPAQAHSGRRCLYFHADRGLGYLRYGPMPAPDDKPWTLRFWARGQGKLVVTGYKVLRDRWEPLPPTALPPTSGDLTADWRPCELRCTPGPGRWVLEVFTQGPTEVWLDDFSLTYPGLPALGLPPDAPLTKDDHTLLYLPFEEPLNEDAFFLKPQVSLSAPGEGRFGRCLVFGPEGYVACSANENLDPSQGTIEVWAKFLSPGNDGVYHGIVQVPGPEGMSLCKDQYGHISFGFASGWAPLSYCFSDGYANPWQPGVWRHFAACWDKDLMELFVDGKLIAWKLRPRLSRALGPELGLGGPGMALDDLRISNLVRYRLPVPGEE